MCQLQAGKVTRAQARMLLHGGKWLELVYGQHASVAWNAACRFKSPATVVSH